MSAKSSPPSVFACRFALCLSVVGLKLACGSFLCGTLFWATLLWGTLAPAAMASPPHQFGSDIVATSGNHQLTVQQLNLAVVFAQDQAGANFSADDTATLKADLIAWFENNPDENLFTGVVNSLRHRNLMSENDLGIARYNYWDQFGKRPETFETFKTEPWYGVILKYNPILVRAEGMVITQRDVDWQFNANSYIAEIAGVAPPSEADKERFARTLPSRFASMSVEEREQLRRSQLGLAQVKMCMQGAAVDAKDAIQSYIQANVHASEDVAGVARKVENDAQYKHHCGQAAHFAPVIVATSGDHQLTDQELNLAVVYAEVQAGTDFSVEDTATLKADAIAWFNNNPDEDLFGPAANALKKRNLDLEFDLGVLRYIYWDQFGKHPEALQIFKTEPWYGVILKYNPILVEAEGMVITQRDVDWQFNAEIFVAEIAKVAPPSQADKERFARTLPSRFASMSAQEREQLRGSQVRLARVIMCMQGTAIKTRAAIESYIQANVHGPDDVARVARQVENDSQPQQIYERASVAEMNKALNASLEAQNFINRKASELSNLRKQWREFMRPDPGAPPF